ncbi:MAG: hypothetical protein JWN23_814 [Rhodocyclales bacterium]|nr:hypothetical protein [Rhodocyclales bacterium]
MKPVRILVIALLGYAAVLVPTVSQARGVEVFLPGISVRLPAPPIPILVPPGVSVREIGYGDYDGGRDYRRVPPERYYREDWRDRGDWREHAHWRHEREEYRHDDHFDHRDHDDHGRDGGWRR